MVSLVIPTLNSGRTLAACLESIRSQAFPRDNLEIVIADAGSTDDTLVIAARYGADRVVPNPLQTGEAGKAAAIAASRGEFIALIDSDNVLPDGDWLTRMLAPFADERVVGTEPLEYTWRPQDPALTRYFALLGMNDPLCLFLGNYDRLSRVTGRWTEIAVEQEDCGGYLRVRLDPAGLPTIGANGFVLRRALLQHVSWQPYFFDIDIVQQAAAAGFRDVAKVKCGIVHLYCDTLGQFARKQRRRIRDYLFFSSARQRTYPWDRRRRAGVARFAAATLLVLPLLVQAWRGWRRRPDAAWLYHLPVCFLTLAVYGAAAVRRALGFPPPAPARQGWQASDRPAGSPARAPGELPP
jgi:glycosyltransferase involved in cell wall biosynthesis